MRPVGYACVQQMRFTTREDSMQWHGKAAIGLVAAIAGLATTALANAQTDPAAGFTTVLDMDSRGTFYTVELRDAINSGLVQGPRMQVVGQSLNPRATNYYNDPQSVRFYEGYTETKNINGP